MNKEALINAVKDDTGHTKKDITEIVNSLFDNITKGLVEEGKVKIFGFGNFEVRERAARKGHNPQNPSEEITIPARKAPAFKPSKQLKEAVNEQ